MDVDLTNGEPSTSTSTTTTSISKKINSGDHVLLRLADGGMRGVKVDKDAIVSAGRLGTFQANELIGQPYGFTHEIVNKKGLKVLPPRSLQEVEDTEATNELINDGEFVQPLTIAEITALKQSGVHADDIIKKQIDAHANYALKTEYSKEKYRKRKEAKYSKTFTTVEPTLFNVCDHWFKKDNVRVRDIRNDTLSQMLNLANVKPGGRYLAVDDASGLVVAGMLSRMGGEGRILTICDTDSPPAYPVMVQMNFSKEVTKTLTSLNWATSDEDYIPVVPPGELPPDDIRSEKQKTRIKKRKVINDALASTREELFAGGFDALIVATEYDPMSILEKLVPCLSGSASIVVQSPYAAILHNLQNKLRSTPGYLAPTVTESWLRRYQVLPGRTHPTMTTSGTGGYILHAIKVYDDPEALAIESRRPHRSKKPKLESSTVDPVPSSTAVVETDIEERSVSMAVD